MQTITHQKVAVNVMQGRIKYYDGIRGIVALWVAVIHFLAAFYWPLPSGGTIETGDFYKQVLLDGDLCVYIFWLLSAIVISHSLAGPAAGFHRKASEFPIKRYFRLMLPVFFSSLICFLLLSFHLFYFEEARMAPLYAGKTDWLKNLYNFQPNFLSFCKISFFDAFLIGNSNYNAPLWTIGPELFGPFLCLFSLLLYRKHPRKFIFYMVIALSLFIGGLSYPPFYYYLIFIIGLMIYETEHSGLLPGIKGLSFFQFLFHSKMTAYLLLIISLLLGFIYRDRPPFSAMFFMSSLRAIAIVLIIKNTQCVQQILSWRLFQFLGKISFAVYLIHIPLLFSLVSYIYTANQMHSALSILLLFIIFMTLLMICSFVFYKTIEEKSIILAKRMAHQMAGKT